MKSRQYIKEFKNINVTKVCRDLNISISNVSTGKAKDEIYDTIKEELEHRIANLYIKKRGG